jgi:hypothetical protein
MPSRDSWYHCPAYGKTGELSVSECSHWKLGPQYGGISGIMSPKHAIEQITVSHMTSTAVNLTKLHTLISSEKVTEAAESCEKTVYSGNGNLRALAELMPFDSKLGMPKALSGLFVAANILSILPEADSNSARFCAISSCKHKHTVATSKGADAKRLWIL